jgi:hypothetical protein
MNMLLELLIEFLTNWSKVFYFLLQLMDSIKNKRQEIKDEFIIAVFITAKLLKWSVLYQ